MSLTFLRNRRYYENLYDLATIKQCLRIENRPISVSPSVIKKHKTTEGQALHVARVARDLFLYYSKVHRYEQRESSISEMMDRDQQLQDLYDNAVEPIDVQCQTCGGDTFCISKILDDFSDQEERILFMFECTECGKRRAVYADGADKVFKPDLCEKCSHEIKRIYKKNRNVITTIRKCTNCEFAEKEVWDLKKDEQESRKKNERNKKMLAKFRKKYCLSEEEGLRFIRDNENFKRFQEALEKETQQKLDPVYQKMKRLRVLLCHSSNPDCERY